MITKKICSKCQKSLPINNFFKNKSKKDGYNNYCKLCQKIYSRQYREVNKESIREKRSVYKKEYYKKNKEKEKKRGKDFRKKNKEKLNAKSRQYYKENRDEIREKDKERRKTRKGILLHRLYESKRRHKKKQITHLFTYNEWNIKLNKTNGYCPECSNFIGLDKLTLDHIIPISKAPIGYVYTIDDVQPLCISCNSKKKDKI